MTVGRAAPKSASLNQELLRRIRDLRNAIAHGVVRPDGEVLAQQLHRLGILVPPGDLQWFVADLLRGMSEGGEHFVPPALLGVVRGLLDGTRAKLAVDPWAGVGVLAAVVKEATQAAHVIVYATSPGTLALAKALTPQLDWRLARIADPLACLKDLPGSIDITACIPPNELADLSRDLLASPTHLGQIDTRLREFSRRMPSGAATHAAATLEQWFESLPFPLASILRAWQATQSQDHKAKQEHLLHFFEAGAELLSVIYLSAFEARTELFAEHKQRLQEAWRTQNLTLERATFGTWKVVVEYFAKQTRVLAGGDSESIALCRELFADDSLMLPQTLASKDLPTILSTANKIRNDWAGHGGIASQVEASLRNQLLVTELQKLREVMSDGWSRVQLIRAMGCQPKRGMFDNEIAVMMGSNSEFLKDSRTMSIWLDVERLYLVSKDSGRALALLPLIQVGPSPTSAKNACYFFNRIEKDGVRFVSYHFVDQPERKERFSETSEAIRFLTEAATDDDH